MWLPVLSAFLGIVAFLPFNFYPITFIFLVPLFIFFMRENKLWRLLVGATIFRVVFGLGTVYYALEPIFWLSSLLIFLGLPFTVWLIKNYATKSHFMWGSLTSPILIALPVAWTFFDLAEAQYSLVPTYIFSAGNALGSSPFLGLAALGGTGFIALTFFVALVNALFAAFILIWRRHYQVAWRFRRHEGYLLIAILVLLFSGWQISRYELRQNAAAYSALPNSLTIAAVSTNNAFTDTDFTQLTQELAQQKPNLIIFPENLFNQHVGFPKPNMEFPNLAKQLQTPVLAAYDTVQDLPAGKAGAKKYGSAILFDAQGAVADVHNKNRLTFGGEYWPFGSWHPSFYDWLRARDPHLGTYAIFDQKNADTVGERNLLSLPASEGLPALPTGQAGGKAGNSIPFAAPICLEIHYPTDLAEYKAAGARFIVNPSSNRWLSGGLNHFLYLTSNMKKIESVSLQLPIISSGVDDFAGVTLPSGESVQHQVLDKNYTVFFGTIRY